MPPGSCNEPHLKMLDFLDGEMYFEISQQPEWTRMMKKRNVTDNPVISVRNLHKSYGSLKALDGLSFSVQPSSCFGFLGPNGAGKSTLMRILYGTAEREHGKDTAVNVFGFDPGSQSLDIKFLSGVVPQENNLDDELNVTQNLRVYSKLYGMKKNEAIERIGSLLEFFELSEKRKSKIKELSGGMKRRLVIARALLHEPRLLILDEPTTGLDPQVRHLIWDKIRHLQQEGLTVLLTTHYMEEAERLCDSLLIMDKGRKILEGKPRQLIKEHIENYVLEIYEEQVAAVLGSRKIPAGVRKDGPPDRPVFYSNRLAALKRMSKSMEGGGYHIRQSNLEDLFLKATGRELNAEQ